MFADNLMFYFSEEKYFITITNNFSYCGHIYLFNETQSIDIFEV